MPKATRDAAPRSAKRKENTESEKKHCISVREGATSCFCSFNLPLIEIWRSDKGASVEWLQQIPGGSVRGLPVVQAGRFVQDRKEKVLPAL
ncbi:hypothetical protein E2C01_086153 [Portunus trituberculatus]|uniref:Uncharacterized protein n=1 Tax=Portunus trituberculatus TaxID=210409 RepID=A0A5B7JAS0_PORTR|nr:hypothetical protein [Portunus trituberculatus]